ncbi:MAG: class I SAM-dependent methyltransferase [Pseudomonadota bacterium]
MKFFKRSSTPREPKLTHSVRDYRKLVQHHLRENPDDRTFALARSIGAESMEGFRRQGDGHVAVLKHHGLVDGMSVYDLGAGCGRTAQALQRSGWKGSYIGADVVPELLEEIERQCPGYATVIELDQAIAAPSRSLDLVCAWSVFTHLTPPETYLFIRDVFRTLKPGGKLLFTFLEMEEPEHNRVWEAVQRHVQAAVPPEQLDTFLHRDWIRRYARDAGFEDPLFTDGMDRSNHPELWQALAVLKKPERKDG